MSRYSVAKEIAVELNTKYDITWITPWIVQVFIVLSLPVRKFLINYFRTQKSLLEVKKLDWVISSQKGNSLANQLNSLRVAAVIALQPVTDVLKVFPLDTILKEIPEVEQFAGGLSGNVGSFETVSVDIKLDFLQKISPDLAKFLSDIISYVPVAITSNYEGFDLFDGVDSFQDLQDKIDELLFRTSRATALSTYASAGSAYVSNLLDKIDVYIDILDTLDIRGL